MIEEPRYPAGLSGEFDWGDDAPEPGSDAHAAALLDIQQKNDDLDAAMLATFRTAPGKIVLQWLLDTHRGPGFDPALGYEMGIANGFAREGQRLLANEVERRRKRASERRS